MVHCAVDHFGALLRTIPCIQCTIPSTQHTIPKGAISPNSTYNLIRLIALMWGLPEVSRQVFESLYSEAGFFFIFKNFKPPQAVKCWLIANGNEDLSHNRRYCTYIILAAPGS